MTLVAVLAILFVGFQQISIADESSDSAMTEETVDSNVAEAAMEEEAPMEKEEMKEEETTMVVEEEIAAPTGHQLIKKYFIEGGPGFMGIVLICLILGLAFCIERIISLNLSTVNTKKLLSDVDSKLQSGDVEGAKEVCKNTRGPVASIFYQGLSRVSEGIEIVEKSIVSYGSVQMGLLEKGLVWISLFIALAPMLGFMGTVIGMIEAFDAIEVAGDISPGLVAGGIKVALLTTVFGLIVAIILQIFYNYIVSKIDDLVNSMEDASIGIVDLMIKHNVTKKS